MSQFKLKQKLVCWKFVLNLVAFLILPCLPASATVNQGIPDAAKAINDIQATESDIPVPISEGWWTKRHDKLVKRARSSHPDIVFFGDSITAFTNVAMLHRIIGPEAVNFGIPGDQTQHLLWRLRNGELDFSAPAPRVFVVLIGTNNLTKWAVAPSSTGEDGSKGKSKKVSVMASTNQEIFLGVQACLSEIRGRLPGGKILLLGILPRDGRADAPSRQRIKDTNVLLQELADNKHIWYADIGESLLESNGTISPQVMADFLHPTKIKGYTRMFTATKPYLDCMLGTSGN
jgi:lysophospholipase L1-like esterase